MLFFLLKCFDQSFQSHVMLVFFIKLKKKAQTDKVWSLNTPESWPAYSLLAGAENGAKLSMPPVWWKSVTSQQLRHTAVWKHITISLNTEYKLLHGSQIMFVLVMCYYAICFCPLKITNMFLFAYFSSKLRSFFMWVQLEANDYKACISNINTCCHCCLKINP